MSFNANERNRRILIIDDNTAIHADFRKILVEREASSDGDLAKAEADFFGGAVAAATPTKPTFELTTATQGQEGLAVVHKAVAAGRPFAMAFVDVRMPPGWDGIETTARLWEVDPDLQIVICTAYSDYSWEEMSARLGTTDRMVILKKPFDAVEVLQLSNSLTEKWWLLQQAKMKLKDLELAIAERTQELQISNHLLRTEVRERETTEKVLRSIQEKLNHFLAKSPAVLYSIKIQGERQLPTWVSDNFTAFTGFPVQDWYRQVLDLNTVEPGDRNLVHDSLAVLLAQNHASLQYRIHRQDKVVRWVRDDRQLLRDEEGQPIEIIGCLTDITEQRLLEEELRQSQKMESVGLLAGGVAHDFNNLLTVIRCHVDLLLNGEEHSERTSDSLKRILASADRAANLTRQLLAFSRKQIMQTENLDLGEVVSALLKLLARTLGEHISLQSDTPTGLPMIHADRGMIEQVIVNLSVNARDAMSKGGRLSLSICVRDLDESYKKQHPDARAGKFLCLAVADTGTGIAPEHLPRIFEPFFTTKELGKGTGLGLATVYGIVKQHEGWIEVDSRVGEGTIFRVFLPASSADESAVTAAVTESHPTTCGGHETILVVEDEAALRGLAKTTLQRQGYRVFTAASGPEAISNWSARLPQIDLLLTDMVMPNGMSGQELARELQLRKPMLKVIFMSGYSSEINGKEQLNGTPFLAKPFGIQSLTQAVRACLDGR